MKDGIALPLLAVLTSVGLPNITYADNTEQPLEKVTILGDRSPLYRSDDVQLGPLADRPLLDTPYSIDVVPVNLSVNQQLKSVREVFRYMPSVQGENIRPQTRGLQAGVVQNTHIDGMNIAATTDYPIEQFDRIEVLDGLAGALFGPANPAGTFNYVLKRPTLTPCRSVSVSYATQESKLASLDIGDTLGDKKFFGYRVNLLSDRGESYVDLSRLERTLLSLEWTRGNGAAGPRPAALQHLIQLVPLYPEQGGRHHVGHGQPVRPGYFSGARVSGFRVAVQVAHYATTVRDGR
jgi:outer membrane receptor for monomeric catechols